MNINDRVFIESNTSVIANNLGIIQRTISKYITCTSEHEVLDKLFSGIYFRLDDLDYMCIMDIATSDKADPTPKYYDPYDDLDFERDVWVYDTTRCNCSGCRDSYDHRMD